MGVGAYMEKPFVRITHIHANHRITKNAGWALTRENKVLELYGVYREYRGYSNVTAKP